MDVNHLIGAFRALAQDTRLQAFRLLLGAGPEGLPAGEVARRLAAPHNTISTHLAILSRAGLTRSRRDSRQIIYAVDLDTVRRLVTFLVEDCCGGQPERCAALLAAAMPVSSCAPAGGACRPGRAA